MQLETPLWKRVVVWAVVLVGLILAAPNLFYSRVETRNDAATAIAKAEKLGGVATPDQTAALAVWPAWAPSGLVNLGLDLRGGAHLLAEVKLADVYKQRMDAFWPDARDALKEVRLALLEADVNFKVARDFIKSVQEACLGEEVLNSVTPGQQVVKVIHDELVKLLGEGSNALSTARPLRILMVGLHGSGKTTSTAKLRHRPFVVGAEAHRRGAVDQLDKFNH